MIPILLAGLVGLLPLASGHASIWHPSMWGFNVTQQTYSYDNRPVSPLSAMTFNQWWFHGHLDHPPNNGDIFELPAGQAATTEIGCNKGATSFFASSEGGDIRNGDDPCPGSPPSEYHTTGPNDLKGCSLAIAYKNDVNQVQPEDFTVFSVNQTCVFHRFTDFQVPERMPSCPEGGCICAWFWVHSPDSGGEQNYMNGFKCNITGSTSNVALAQSQVPRRCGADPDNGKPQAALGNCTYGAKQPFYWFQTERNNMFEGAHAPPFYNDLYNFKDGAQNDIFLDSYPSGLPSPSPNSTFVPVPSLGGAVASPSVSVSAGPGGTSVTASGSLTSQPSAPAVPTLSSSTSSAPSSSASISSLSGSRSAPSASFSQPPTAISTATVVSTVVVTVISTISPLPSSTFPAAVPITTSITPSGALSSLSAVSSPVVSATHVVSAAPTSAISSSSPSSSPVAASAASSFLGATTILLNDPAFTAASSAPSVFPSSQSPTGSRAFAQLERVTNDAVVDPTSTPVASFTSSTDTLRTCKRQMTPNTNLRRRSPYSFSIPGVGHRRMLKRSSLWRIF